MAASASKPKWSSAIFGTYPSSSSAGLLSNTSHLSSSPSRNLDVKPPLRSSYCSSYLSNYKKYTPLGDSNNNTKSVTESKCKVTRRTCRLFQLSFVFYNAHHLHLLYSKRPMSRTIALDCVCTI